MVKEKNFKAYRASDLASRNSIKNKLKRLKNKFVYDFVMLPFGLKKHQTLLKQCERINDHTYTCFYRAPTQLQAIAGPVMSYLGNPEQHGQPISILAFACSNGAEVFTLASWLMMRLPNLNFNIVASDLHPEMISRCKEAKYTIDEALHCEYITDEFISNTFDREGDHFVVKQQILEKITFTQASLLDLEEMKGKFGNADIVLAQNVLFHMPPQMARQAFHNASSFLKEKGVFLVEGMDIEHRYNFSTETGLKPLEWKIKNIYLETRIHTPVDWWNFYWGTEPYLPFRKNKSARYGTIFLKG